MAKSCRCLNCITPPHLLRKLLESEDEEIRQSAMNTLLMTEHLRGERTARAMMGVAATPSGGRRTIFNCDGGTHLPSCGVARTEDGPSSKDPSVNQAFKGLGTTRDFFRTVFDRDSLDGQGMRLNAFVHRSYKYNNAFWDGSQMVFGDGDGRLFTDFTLSLDVIAHELAHGVTEFTAGLDYHKQPGALNESMSDVFGSLVKQWSLKQSAAQADWLIGAEIFTPKIGADALRSMKNPGEAYNNALMGKDPQPAHMAEYKDYPDTQDGDWGGVHINSGIPNRAFYVTATVIGGKAWEAAGHIWYEALKASGRSTQFQEFADTTFLKAGQLYGTGSGEQQAVAEGWDDVGISVTQAAPAGSRARPKRREEDGLAALRKRLEALSQQVQSLMEDLDQMKVRG